MEAAKRPQTVRGAPSPQDWDNHVRGRGDGLGLIPLLDDDTNIRWGAIDIDVYKGLDHAALEHDVANLPLVITKSKSGGAHLWVFFREPVNAELARNRMTQW